MYCHIVFIHCGQGRFQMLTLPVGLLALGQCHGIDSGTQNNPSDLEVAQDLMLTCYEMCPRIPAGLCRT